MFKQEQIPVTTKLISSSVNIKDIDTAIIVLYN